MTDPDAFDTPIRRDERAELHEELVNRLHQRGVRIDDNAAPTDDLADLLSALDAFDTAVERAGGDLFVDRPDAAEPERPDFVAPHQRDGETVQRYTARILAAAERVKRGNL